MTEPRDIRLVQLARILGVSAEQFDTASARDAIAARPGDVASAFFAEAAASDDVVSVKSAREFLEDRITFFADLIPNGTADAIRSAFDERTRAWEK